MRVVEKRLIPLRLRSQVQSSWFSLPFFKPNTHLHLQISRLSLVREETFAVFNANQNTCWFDLFRHVFGIGFEFIFDITFIDFILEFEFNAQYKIIFKFTFSSGDMNQPYLDASNQFPMQNIPQYPSVLYPQQYPNNNPWNPNYGNQDPTYNYQPQQPIIYPPNYLNTNQLNPNSNPAYDQIRRNAQIAERSARIRKWIICSVVILIVIGVILAIVLPIVLTGASQFNYQLQPGYSFTGNTNCTYNFSIMLSWVSSGRDLDLAVSQPGGRQVQSSNANGRYGTFQGDSFSGPAVEQYRAFCAATGQFEIKVRHFVDFGSSTSSLCSISVAVNNVASGAMTKNINYFGQDTTAYNLVGKFIISENTLTRMWKFKLV